MNRLFILALLFLTACAAKVAPEPAVVIREVKVAVPVPCRIDMPPAPEWFDTATAIRAAKGADERAALVMAGRKQRQRYTAELTAALKACKGPTP